jgi:hypothetical protein
MEKFIQFEDDTETVVIASFSCPQDPDVFPNQGAVESDDPRYLAFEATLPKTPF